MRPHGSAYEQCASACAAGASGLADARGAGVPRVCAPQPANGWRALRGTLAIGTGLCLLLATVGCRSSGAAGVTMDGESEAEVHMSGGGGIDLETAHSIVDLIGKSAAISQSVTQQWLDYSNTKAAMGMAERESRRQQRYETLRALINSRYR